MDALVGRYFMYSGCESGCPGGFRLGRPVRVGWLRLVLWELVKDDVYMDICELEGPTVGCCDILVVEVDDDVGH